MDNMERIFSEMDYEAFEKAVEMTLEASTVYIIGLRSSSFFSRIFSLLFKLLAR